MHSLIVINPGHFHAALTLREMHPNLSKDVYVYAEEGADLRSFIRLVNSFNNRKDNPTSWDLHVYGGDNFLERAVDEAKGDIAIFAGKNNRKIHYIKAMHDAGIKVLSDKPLIINQRGINILTELLTDGAEIDDIMTEHYEITSILQKELMADKDIFGELVIDGDEPAIVKESVHHLFKNVNGRALVRPPWYFDVNVQGEGIVDVTTHLTDLIQWMVFEGEEFDFETDYELCEAKRWHTDIPLDKFSLITKQKQFQREIMGKVKDDVLKLYSNGEFTYKLKGVPVKLSVVWALEAPEGGGDTHYSIMRGTKSDLLIEQGPQTGNKPELFIKAHGDLDEMEALLNSLIAKQNRDGLEVIRDGEKLRLEIPAELRTSHEEHFAAVRDNFIACIDGEKEFPANMKSALEAKYSLLAAAQTLAAKK